MSILGKTWRVKNNETKTSLLKKLLTNRGLKDDDEIERFLHPNATRDFHDPFLIKDMQRAIERIGKAIEKSERIMIFGDYDVDGITGCAILMRTLRKLGANVSYRLPHRIDDGYGMREKFVREFKKLAVSVVITVDNGISCWHEIELANSLGIDVILTDHHSIPEKIPNAYALLHPKLPDTGYPFTELTGAGVALKLAQALLMKRIKDSDEQAQFISSLLDLACMGTIADVGELRGENRYIVKEGLKILENTRWPGLSRLKQSAGIEGKIDAHDIGFLLGPRINAAGRISHPSHALRLLLHDSGHTSVLAENLEQLNQKRQKLMAKLFEIADILAAELLSESVIMISHADFHGGIIGLLAAKISEKYFRPAIVMEDRGEILVGSCRSIPGINILEIISSAKDLFTHFGGHAAAAGFELPKEKLKTFEKRIVKNTKDILSAKSSKPTLDIDCTISHEDISEKTIEVLKWFEPFGMGNERPKFLCESVPIDKCGTVGKDNKHLKFQTVMNGKSISCIGFSLGQFINKLNGVDKTDLVCEIEEDTWKRNKNIQLKIVDFKI